MLLKAMDCYNWQSAREWEQLVDEVVMTKNRLLQCRTTVFLQCRVFGLSTHEFQADCFLVLMEIGHYLQESEWGTCLLNEQ